MNLVSFKSYSDEEIYQFAFLLTKNFHLDFKLVHFFGYLRSDLNQKYEIGSTSSNNSGGNDLADDPCSSSQFKVNNDALFRSHHSTTFLDPCDDDLNQKNRNQYLNENKPRNGESSPTQHYLLAYAQIKSKLVNELDQTKFVTKHNLDGKFLYVEPRFVLL